MEYRELANHSRLLDAADGRQPAATAGNWIIGDSQFRNASTAQLVSYLIRLAQCSALGQKQTSPKGMEADQSAV